jgi:hypothetical protein
MGGKIMSSAPEGSIKYMREEFMERPLSEDAFPIDNGMREVPLQTLREIVDTAKQKPLVFLTGNMQEMKAEAATHYEISMGHIVRLIEEWM